MAVSAAVDGQNHRKNDQARGETSADRVRRWQTSFPPPGLLNFNEGDEQESSQSGTAQVPLKYGSMVQGDAYGGAGDVGDVRSISEVRARHEQARNEQFRVFSVRF